MRIVINTTVPIDPTKRYESWDKRYKDEEDGYVLQEHEAFATDLEGLREMFHLKKIDYKRYRAGLQYWGNVDTSTWDAYTISEKEEISRENATDFERVAATLGALTEEYMEEFDRKSIENRRKRFAKAKAILLSNVALDDAFQILSEARSFNLEDNYISHGVEGHPSQDPVLGLFDFIEATDEAGVDAYGNPWNTFSTTGIAARTLTFLPHSTLNNTTLVANMMSKLTRGK